MGRFKSADHINATVSEASLAAFSTLCESHERTLREVFRLGVKPDLDALEGSAFKGRNVGPLTRALGIERFVKCFFRSPGDSALEGCNLWVRPYSRGNRWELMSRRPHGFYLVRTEWEPSWGPSQKNSVMIDYAASARNFRLNPERLIDDYLVQPDPADPDLYLGKAFLGLGKVKVFSNYFVLVRHEDSARIFEEILSESLGLSIGAA